MLEILTQNLLSFIAIISIIVFIHEFGHFFVARLCKVKVEIFSIGFGKEIFGFFDKKGTRWKFCLIPMGGYVKMFGDKSAASNPDFDKVQNFSEQEKRQSFIFKNVYQKIAIVGAGPLANFILAIFLFTGLYYFNGAHKALPIIDEILQESAAFESGLKISDRITAINGKKIEEFADIQEIIALNPEKELKFNILRADNKKIISVTPKLIERKNLFGETTKIGMLGISSNSVKHYEYNILESFIQANKTTYKSSVSILNAIGLLITGQRNLKELGGPIKIAKYSGKTFELGPTVVVWFMALISINLGVMNLLPLPILDGGHLLFYFFEAVFKKPVPIKIQQIGFQFGLAVILTLMIFTTYNDIAQILQ